LQAHRSADKCLARCLYSDGVRGSSGNVRLSNLLISSCISTLP